MAEVSGDVSGAAVANGSKQRRRTRAAEDSGGGGGIFVGCEKSVASDYHNIALSKSHNSANYFAPGRKARHRAT